MIELKEIIFNNQEYWFNRDLTENEIRVKFGEPELYTPSHKSYPTILVYGNVEFRFRNEKLCNITVDLASVSHSDVNIIGDFKNSSSYKLPVIIQMLDKNHINWGRDEIMSTDDFEVIITENNVHLGFYRSKLIRLAVQFALL